MPFDILELCLAYFSTLILLIFWFIFSKHRNFRICFAAGIFLLMLINGVIGYITWDNAYWSFRASDFIFFTSSMWLVGPLMLIMSRNKVSVILVPLLCLVLPILSMFLGAFLAIVMDPPMI